MPQGRKRSAVEIFEQGQRPTQRKRSAVEIFELGEPSPSVQTASTQQPVGAAEAFGQEVAGGVLQGAVKPVVTLSDAIASATFGDFQPLLDMAERAGRSAVDIGRGLAVGGLVSPAAAIPAYTASQTAQAPRMEELRRRAEARLPEPVRSMEAGYRQEAARPRTTGGKVAGAAGKFLGVAAPAVATGILTGGSAPALAATAAIQSAAEPENLPLNVGAAVTPLPLGKLVAPILRRIRRVKSVEAAAPEVAGFAPEMPRPSPSLAKAIGQDAFDDARVAVDELGLSSVPQPTRPNGAVPVRREIPVDSITLSRDKLSRGRMFQAQEGLKQGFKEEGQTFTTLGGKQRPVDPIQVVPDPQTPGKFIVEGDGNHRVALLKLQGNNELIPVKSFETAAQSGAVDDATAALTQGYYRPQMELPTLEAAPVEPFGVSLGKETARQPGAVGPRLAEFGYAAPSTQNPGIVKPEERTGILKTLVSLWKAGLLTRPNTHLKNLGFNAGFALSEEAARVPAAIADIVAGRIAAGGRRTITGPSPGAVGRSVYESLTEGYKQAKQVILNGATEAELEQQALSQLNSGSKVIDTYVNGVFRALTAEDKFARAYALRRALEDRARATALNEIRAGEIARGQYGERVRELIKEPPEWLAAAAKGDEEIAVFANENLVSGGVRTVKGYLEGVGTRKAKLASAGIEFTLPFPRTPTNVIGLMLEYAGGGYVKNIGQVAKAIASKGMTEAEQRAFAQSFGRASVGVPLIVLGSILYKKGLMTGYVEDDPKRKARDEAAGRVPGAVLVGDTWHQVVGTSPFGNLMTIGATIQRESDQERDDALKAYTEAAARFVGEQPLMTGAKQLTAPLTQPGTFVSKTVGGFAGGLVPGLVSDVAQTFDSTRRQSDTVYRQVAGRIPGLRGTLPERPDVLGRPVPLPFPFDPTKSTTAQEATNPLMAELVRLDQGISGFEKTKPESDEDFAEKQRTFGQLYGQYGLSLINSPSYRNQPDVAKQEIFDLFNQRLKTLITENQERFAQAKLSPPALLQAFRESQLRKLQKRKP